MEKAIITAVGKDKPGIIAAISTLLSEKNINILDVTQTVMESSIFTMSMLVELDMQIQFKQLKKDLEELGQRLAVEIYIQREDVFDAMAHVYK